MNKRYFFLALLSTINLTTVCNPVAVTNKTNAPLKVITYDREGKMSDIEIIKVKRTYKFRSNGSPGRKRAIHKITWQNIFNSKDFNKKLKRGSYDFKKYKAKVNIGADATGYKLVILPKGEIKITQEEKATAVKLSRKSSGSKHNNNNNDSDKH